MIYLDNYKNLEESNEPLVRLFLKNEEVEDLESGSAQHTCVFRFFFSLNEQKNKRKRPSSSSLNILFFKINLELIPLLNKITRRLHISLKFLINIFGLRNRLSNLQ